MSPRLLLLAALAPMPLAAQDSGADTAPDEATVASDDDAAAPGPTANATHDAAEPHAARGNAAEVVYQPRTVRHGEYELQVGATFLESGNFVSDVPVDASGTEWSADPWLDGEIRLGAHFHTGYAWKPVRLSLAWEHELVSGTHLGGLSEETAAALIDPPGARDVNSQLRRASATLDITQYVHIGGGVMTSHWGLGLLANDGAQHWQPGSAAFVDPRSGDVVERVYAAFGPFTSRNLLFALAADQVRHDDQFRSGDEARQLVFSALMGYGQPTQAGAYVVAREQDARDGDETRVIVVDAYGRHTFELGDRFELGVAGEFAAITGTSTLAPTADHPERDVLQMGGLARVSFSAPTAGVVLDVGWATGDADADDDQQNAFRFDRNAEMGLLLYRTVQAAMTSRAPITASNPELVGEPAEDLDRVPSRGAVSDTIAFFPRGWVRPIDTLEIYGGPLIALAAAAWADPLETRLAGGVPTNALGGESGRYIGTEIDLGARWTADLAGSVLNLGVEGGVLLPGAALADGPTVDMPLVWGGRLLFHYAL